MFYSTAVAWSFGSTPKKLEFTKRTLTPGPGNYNESKTNHNRSVSYSFGRQEKLSMKSNFVPGPGAYLKPNENLLGKRSPSFTINKSKPPVDLFPRTANISFYETTKKWEVPSPNQYTIDLKIETTKKKNPAYKFSKTTRMINYDNRIPGPGAYKKEMNVIKPNAPKWSILKKEKEDVWHLERKKSSSINPGPGMYNNPSKIGEGPKVFCFNLA